MSDNLLLLYRAQVVGTYTDAETEIELTDVSRLVGQLPLNLNMYKKTLGTAVDAYDAGAFEVLRVISVDEDTSIATVLREQEGTTAVTIDSSTWEVFQAINPKTISDVDHVPTNGSPTTFEAGTKGQRKIDPYFLYECIAENYWVRYPRDLSYSGGAYGVEWDANEPSTDLNVLTI